MSAIRARKPVKPGSLKLSLAEARNLPENKKGDGFLNPYCILGPIDGTGNHIPDQLEKTAIIKRTLRPGWHSTYHFPIEADFKGLVLEVFNDDPKKPKFLGQVQFPPEILIDGRDLSTWFSLDKRPADPPKVKLQIKGDIYVSLFYMSFEMKENDPERYNQSFDHAALAAKCKTPAPAAAKGAPPKAAPGGQAPAPAAPKKPEKKLDQIDDILRDVRASKPEAAHQLLNYILLPNSFSEIESLDAAYAKNSLEKGTIDALLQGLAGSPDSAPDFRAYVCAYLGRIIELDNDVIAQLFSAGVIKLALESVLALSGTNIEHLKLAIGLFNTAKYASVKQQCLDIGVIPGLFKILRNHSASADVAALCCKALNLILAEAETTVPSKKDLATAIVECGGMTEAMKICGNLASNADVIEQWFPLMDTCLELAPKLDAISTDGVAKLISIIEKHRFVIQVYGACILSRLAENDDFAKAITQAGGVHALVKVLGTESNLSKFEQKSREVCLKCLNKCALFPEGIEHMKQGGLPKILDAAMRGYGNMFIIQIQGIILIRAIAKDEEMLKMLKDINVSSLIAFSASKQKVNRLEKLVKELQETYQL